MDLSTLRKCPGRQEGSQLEKTPLRRAPLSRYLCGMLNTGLGGTFYLGVTDSGRVEGLLMSQYQKVREIDFIRRLLIWMDFG